MRIRQERQQQKKELALLRQGFLHGILRGGFIGIVTQLTAWILISRSENPHLHLNSATVTFTVSVALLTALIGIYLWAGKTSAIIHAHDQTYTTFIAGLMVGLITPFSISIIATLSRLLG